MRSPDGQSYNGHWALPNADASLFFRHKAGLYSADMKILAADGFTNAVLLPAEDPRFFLALRQQTKVKDRADICATADRRSRLTVSNLEKMTRSILYTNWGLVGGSPRIHYLHSARVLLALPESNDRVVIRSLEPAPDLKQPNATAVPDQTRQMVYFVEDRTLAATSSSYKGSTAAGSPSIPRANISSPPIRTFTRAANTTTSIPAGSSSRFRSTAASIC